MNEASSPESSDAGVSPGDVLAGKYRVEKVLGVGGMGIVVAAHHLQLDEKVALKFLLPHALTNAEAMSRFEREARAAVKIKSEHVARVSDVGKLDNGSPYMVMEYLEGSDLSAWLEKRGALPIEDAVEFVLQACEAIAEAHALGIVHRDLKPANLFCVRRADGRLSIKVLDFGISKMTTGAADVSMTRTTAIMGSPLYMSPEQMQSSKQVDARADIWALGVILFELISGSPPFDAGVVTELVIKIATQEPSDLRTLRADVPEGLVQIIMRCLEKEASRRYANVGAFALALESFGPKRSRSSIERILGTMEAAGMSSGVLLPSVPPASAPASKKGAAGVAGSGTQASWGGSTGSGARPHKRTIIGAIAAVAALLMIGGLLLAKKGAAPEAHLAAAAAPPSPPPVSPATVQAPAPVAIAAPAPAVPIGNPAVATPAPEAPSAPATASAVPHRSAHAATRGAPAVAPPHAAAKVSCNPPYYYDANGTRVFKKECL